MSLPANQSGNKAIIIHNYPRPAFQLREQTTRTVLDSPRSGPAYAGPMSMKLDQYPAVPKLAQASESDSSPATTVARCDEVQS